MGKLHEAAMRGDSAKVMAYLDDGADPNETGDEHGTTALTSASFLGHVDVVRLLLDRGADVDRPNKHGSRPLGAAARNAKVAVIPILLDAGASLAMEGAGGTTAFMDAAVGTPRTVRVFLDRGADVNHVSSKGFTALHCAARNDIHGHEIIPLLLAAGADPSRRDSRGRTPRELAVELGHIRNAALLETVSKTTPTT